MTTTYRPAFPTNTDDVIDSRDVIFHIDDLTDDLEDAATDEEREQIEEDLAPLLALADEAEDAPDWQHGETLIRDSYFVKYAEELANDCGMVERDLTWPLTHIDWEGAAEALQSDYTEVDFDGVSYWIHI